MFLPKPWKCSTGAKTRKKKSSPDPASGFPPAGPRSGAAHQVPARCSGGGSAGAPGTDPSPCACCGCDLSRLETKWVL